MTIAAPEAALQLPAVSIGLPVFNGATMLDAAIGTLLAQDFRDFELLISNNASTDETHAICERYAAGDRRIRYVRQPRNLGPLLNFRFLAQNARADLFVWAAVDDTRSPDFLRVNVEFLRANPAWVGSISPTRYEGDPDHAVEMGDDVLDAPTPGQRMVRFLQRSHPNSIFYAVLCREPLLRALDPIAWYFGFDWTVMLRLSRIGPIKRLDAGWLERGARGWSNRADIVARSRSRSVHWVLPFYDLSREVIALARDVDARSRRRVLLSLLRLNASAMRHQARYEFGRLWRHLCGRSAK